jgi:Winged helix-turn helix
MVLLSIRAKTVPEIAEVFAVCEATGRFWLRRFNVDGPAGLYDRERSGRPRKVTIDAVISPNRAHHVQIPRADHARDFSPKRSSNLHGNCFHESIPGCLIIWVDRLNRE